MDTKAVIERVKAFDWEHRVFRTGFLQSKGIVNEAEVLTAHLTKNISITYDNVFWVQDINLYDNKQTKSFAKDFKEAFEEDKHWPENIVKDLDLISEKINKFIKDIKEEKDKIKLFLEYVKLLKETQKFYLVAVPLTRYCEKELKNQPEILQEYAVPYKELDIDKIHTSKDPLKEFAWVKTAYNIVEELEEKDVKQDHKEIKSKKQKTKIPQEIQYLVTGLQVGIYTRNRMKELAQMLWYYIDPVAKSMAKQLGISRDDFFTLTYKEVIDSLENNKLRVTKEEIEKRKQCFAIGILDNKEFIFSGEDAKDLLAYYSKDQTTSKEVKGNVACQGEVTGTVKVITSKDQFSKLQVGDILVTPMTTPDFVIIMKKAAGIITDEGGLSCHAAIVSRELEIPCIIGTKNATRVLKDGDKVKLTKTGEVLIL